MFSEVGLKYSDEDGRESEPKLSEMAGKAIQMLKKVKKKSDTLQEKIEQDLFQVQSPSGFLLVVEGGAIDSAHHNAMIRGAIQLKN